MCIIPDLLGVAVVVIVQVVFTLVPACARPPRPSWRKVFYSSSLQHIGI